MILNIGIYKHHISKIVVVSFLTTILIACSSSDEGSDSPGITYTGNDKPAVISATNASALIANIIGDNDATGLNLSTAFSKAPASNNSEIKSASITNRIVQSQSQLLLRNTGTQTSSPRAAKVRVDESQPCESGSLNLSGALDDNDGTGDFVIVFNDCLADGLTISGVAKMKVDEFDFNYLEITDFTLSFSQLIFTRSTYEVVSSGSMHSKTSIFTNTETHTFNMVSRDNLTKEEIKSENLLIITRFDNIFTPSSFTETITGRIYHATYGYVDVTTNKPLRFNNASSSFPDDGELVFTGAGNSKIVLRAASETAAIVALDVDNDDKFEITAFLKWDDISNEAGENLNDSDQDGMHDSWELANGLDPSNAIDATLDTDFDNVSNILEYQNSTDPDNANSTPPVTDLSVTLLYPVSNALTGRSFEYVLSINNAGPDVAYNALVQYVLPPGLNFISAGSYLWDCSYANNTVSCTRENIAASSTSTINIVVEAPFTNGDVLSTFIVSSGTSDIAINDNSYAELTTITPPVSDLSVILLNSADQVLAGSTFEYILTINNAGPDTALNALVQNVLPPALTFVSVSNYFGWDCNYVSHTVSCARASIEAGAAFTITISVEAPLTNEDISNTVGISSNTSDTNISNDNSTEITTVLLPSNSLNLDLAATAFDMEYDSIRHQLYVSIPDQNEIVIVSPDTLSELNRIATRTSPLGIDISQDGNTLYIALNQGGAVAMLDLDTLQQSEVSVAAELGLVIPNVPALTGGQLTYDVIAATPTEIFVSGSPNSAGISYIVKIDTANGNQVSRVASDRVIRAEPFFVVSPDQQFLYISEGFSPNSIYKLDLTQADAPIVLEDVHLSIIAGANEHLSINLDGSRLFLASGQILDTSTLTQAALIDKGVSIVSNDGSKVYVGRSPNFINIFDTTSYLLIDSIATTCDITEVKRIIELQVNMSWILMGQQNICRVSRN